MSEGLPTSFSGPNMANGSSPDDQLHLEAARKRLKIEQTTSESESPLDAQIRHMTKELEELKKQRQVAELQEQIWAERQLLEASRNRLSVAAALASSTSSSPAPAPASAPATFTATSTALMPTSPAVTLPPLTTQPVAKPPVEQNNTPAAASPNVNRPFAAPQPVAVQLQTPRASAQSPNVEPQNPPLDFEREGGTTPMQPQAFSSPSASNGVANSTPSRRPSTVSTSVPVAPKQQQKEQQQKQQMLKEQLQKEQQRKQQEQKQQQQKEQQQQPWFGRPCTPGAPADSTLNQLPPYQGLTREEYANFTSALEAHFAKAPQYYTKDREYRKVKLGLQYLAPAPRDSWHALADHPDTWQNFRIFLFKEVVRNLKPIDQPRLTNTTQPPTPKVETAQTPAAKQPPPAQSSMPKVQPAKPAQQSPQAQRNGSVSHGPPSATPNPNSKAVVATFVNCQQNLRETVQTFSDRLRRISSFNAELSLPDRMGFLKKGVVPSIRNRAHRPSSYFRNYDEYVIYLQDIEDTLPQRQAELKGEQPPQMTGSSRVPVAWDENLNHQTTQQPPSARRGRSPARAVEAQSNVSPQAPKSLAGPAVRSQTPPGSSPSRPENGTTSPAARKSVSRRMSSPAPLETNLKPTDGRDWWACRNYIGHLEAHFRDHPRYFTTEERKVSIGRRYICPSLRGKWNAFASKHPQMTWFDVCVFVINQSAQNFAPEDAATRYIRCSQKSHQKIREFALWVQQFAPHYQRPGWDELRHLWDRTSTNIRWRARKDWKEFNGLAPFVAYLETLEDPDIPRNNSSGNALRTVPRKRSRED